MYLLLFFRFMHARVHLVYMLLVPWIWNACPKRIIYIRSVSATTRRWLDVDRGLVFMDSFNESNKTMIQPRNSVWKMKVRTQWIKAQYSRNGFLMRCINYYCKLLPEEFLNGLMLQTCLYSALFSYLFSNLLTHVCRTNHANAAWMHVSYSVFFLRILFLFFCFYYEDWS